MKSDFEIKVWIPDLGITVTKIQIKSSKSIILTFRGGGGKCPVKLPVDAHGPTSTFNSSSWNSVKKRQIIIKTITSLSGRSVLQWSHCIQMSLIWLWWLLLPCSTNASTLARTSEQNSQIRDSTILELQSRKCWKDKIVHSGDANYGSAFLSLPFENRTI